MSDNEILEQNKEVVRRYWHGKWNERRPEILDEIHKADLFYHGTAMDMHSAQEYKEVYGMFLSILQDSTITIEDMIAEGDKVMTRTTLRAVHVGELDGIPPSGRSVELTGYTVFRLLDGKIAEEWEVWDWWGLYQQLGMELKPRA